jgi:hypothetical protein
MPEFALFVDINGAHSLLSAELTLTVYREEVRCFARNAARKSIKEKISAKTVEPEWGKARFPPNLQSPCLQRLLRSNLKSPRHQAVDLYGLHRSLQESRKARATKRY